MLGKKEIKIDIVTYTLKYMREVIKIDTWGGVNLFRLPASLVL
jgi:hypothetical protein